MGQGDIANPMLYFLLILVIGAGAALFALDMLDRGKL